MYYLYERMKKYVNIWSNLCIVIINYIYITIHFLYLMYIDNEKMELTYLLKDDRTAEILMKANTTDLEMMSITLFLKTIRETILKLI